jgi:uncharacterized membrane protein YhaH (DUF805 family)
LRAGRLVDLKYLFISVDGRISRAKFWIGTIILTALNVAAVLLIVARFGMSDLSVKLTVAVALVLLYPTYALMAKRFQDRDKPGWLAVFPLAAIYGMNMLETAGLIQSEPQNATYVLMSLLVIGLSLWALIELGLLKGTQGPNRFGPDPLGVPKADATL